MFRRATISRLQLLLLMSLSVQPASANTVREGFVEFDSACEHVTSTVAMEKMSPQLISADDKAELIANIKKCNSHPETSYCEGVRAVIREQQLEVPPALTCKK